VPRLGLMLLRYLRGRVPFVHLASRGSGSELRDTAKLRREGVLTNVLRIGDRLSVTIRLEGRDHVAMLGEWKPPPTVDEVEAALRRGVGKTVQAVGAVETGGQQPLPPDHHGY